MSGNMVAITDDTGAVAAKISYTPFGEMIERSIAQPACDIPVGFAGQYGVLQEPNGLYYMNARYYDPTMGRFLSEDPIGLSGGDLTLYSYAGNNPVVFVDPSGLCSQSSGTGVPLSSIGWVGFNVANWADYGGVGGAAGKAAWNTAWSTASQSPATFRMQINASSTLPAVGKSLGRISLPVSIAATAIDATAYAYDGQYRNAAIEAGTGFGATAAALGTAAALQWLDATPAAIITIPIGVGAAVYYGGQALFPKK